MTERSTEEELRLRLHPLTTSANLIRASILITCFELLKESIIGQPRSFLASEWNEHGEPLDSDAYTQDVLQLSRYELEASVMWHVNMHAITAEEAAAFERLRLERNRLAHELGRYVVDPDSHVDIDLLSDAVGLGRSLSRFWGSIHVETDPQFDEQEIDYEEIRSGTVLLIENFQSAALLAASMTELAAQDLAGEIDLG